MKYKIWWIYVNNKVIGIIVNYLDLILFNLKKDFIHIVKMAFKVMHFIRVNTLGIHFDILKRINFEFQEGGNPVANNFNFKCECNLLIYLSCSFGGGLDIVVELSFKMTLVER